MDLLKNVHFVCICMHQDGSPWAYQIVLKVWIFLLRFGRATAFQSKTFDTPPPNIAAGCPPPPSLSGKPL